MNKTNVLSKNCPVCLNKNLKVLSLKINKCMRSDGLIVKKRLVKMHCCNCGLLFSRIKNPNSEYFRSNGKSPNELIRHEKIGEGLTKIFTKFLIKEKSNILEIGAANFSTALKINELNPNFKITAIDNNPELVIHNKNIKVINCDFLKLTINTKFDVCYSNNVIEHFENPIQFLKKIKGIVKKNGLIITCCPSYINVTNEILFSDHNYHFTKTSMLKIANQSGLTLIDEFSSSWDIYSHVYIFKNIKITSNETLKLPSYQSLLIKRSRHLLYWSKIDIKIFEKLKKNHILSIFGAGEYTQLIKTYLPKTWSRIEKIIVDQITGIRIFEKKIFALEDSIFSNNDLIIIGAQKNTHSIIIKKLIQKKVLKKNIITLSK